MRAVKTRRFESLSSQDFAQFVIVGVLSGGVPSCPSRTCMLGSPVLRVEKSLCVLALHRIGRVATIFFTSFSQAQSFLSCEQCAEGL